jgi:hypothetical protein
MSSQVFQKTENGKAEIAKRQAGLSPATRSVLVMVNGCDAVAVLMARGLPQLQGHLDRLLALGLIEPVVALVAPAVTRSSPPTSTWLPAQLVAREPVLAVPPPVLVPEQEASHDPRLGPLCRKALIHLGQHFGADTPLVAQTLLAARNVAEFNAGLDGIESKLSIHLGRKQAARELQLLRPAA